MLEHPCISYAARYGVGTISRKDPSSTEILRDYTRRPGFVRKDYAAVMI